MAWTTPRTWVFGEFITAEIMNIHIKDNSLYLAGTMPFPLVDVPYSDADFLGPGGSADWVVDGVDVVTNTYAVDGKMMTWAVYINNSTIANTPANLRLNIPGGYTANAGGYLLKGAYAPSGVWAVGQMWVVSGSQIAMSKLDLTTTFANETNTFHMGFIVSFGVV